MRDAVSPRHGTREVGATFAAAAVATIHVLSGVYADPAGGVFPILLSDDSCQDVASRQSSQATACNPDAPSWTATDRSQVQQVIVADNVDAAGAVAAAAEHQEAPITQLP
jgi:hypothetical protein